MEELIVVTISPSFFSQVYTVEHISLLDILQYYCIPLKLINHVYIKIRLHIIGVSWGGPLGHVPPGGYKGAKKKGGKKGGADESIVVLWSDKL